jgi:hypothetical protein
MREQHTARTPKNTLFFIDFLSMIIIAAEAVKGGKTLLGKDYL